MALLRRGGRVSPRPADGTAPVISGYTELIEIGTGATATVYRARQPEFDRTVAIKVMLVALSDRRSQQRFERERALTGRLSAHPHVATVYDAGLLAGKRPYLVMEYLEGGSLGDRVRRHGPLDVPEVLRIGVKISGALETAHRSGVLHRDIKPQNILVSRFGEPALADFGIAMVLDPEASVTAGLTPVHAAPELLEGDPPSVASDVYALGSTLWTLLAGTAPFAGPPDEGVLPQLMRIMGGNPPPMEREDVPAALTEVLRRALAKHPADRHPSAQALGEALQTVEAGSGRPPTGLVLDPAPTNRQEEPPSPPEADPPVSRRPPDPVLPDAEPTLDRAALPGPRTPTGPPPASEPVAPAVPRSPHPPAAPGPARPLVEPPVVASGGVSAPEEPTVVGRWRAPAAPAAPRRGNRHRVAVTAAVVAIGGLAGAGGIALLTAGGGTHPRDTAHSVTATTAPSRSGTATTARPSGTPTTSATTVAASTSGRAPTGLSARVVGGTIVLHWSDHTGGQAPQLIYTYPSAPGRLPQAVPKGVTTALVQSVVGSEPACFEVVAVLALGNSTGAAAETASSAPACVNGAVPTATRTG